MTQIGGKHILWLRLKEDTPFQSLPGSSGRRLEACELSSWETWVKLLIHGQTLKWKSKRGTCTEALLNTKWFWQGVSLISRDNPKNSIIPKLWLRKLRLRRWNQEGWGLNCLNLTSRLLYLPLPRPPRSSSNALWAEFWDEMSSNHTFQELFFYREGQPTLKRGISSWGWSKQTLSTLARSSNVSSTGAAATSSLLYPQRLAVLS